MEGYVQSILSRIRRQHGELREDGLLWPTNDAGVGDGVAISGEIRGSAQTAGFDLLLRSWLSSNSTYVSRLWLAVMHV